MNEFSGRCTWLGMPHQCLLLSRIRWFHAHRARRASCASRASRSSQTSRVRDPSQARSTGSGSKSPKKTISRDGSPDKNQQSQAGDQAALQAQGAPSVSSSLEHRMSELANFFVYELQRAASCVSTDVKQVWRWHASQQRLVTEGL